MNIVRREVDVVEVADYGGVFGLYYDGFALKSIRR